jgi:dolichyl-phosphate beta-glucosyltransferase
MAEKEKQRKTKKEISIVISAYNEEERIGDRLKEIILYLQRKKYDYEIIIVDDGSKDKTVEIVKEFVGKNKKIRLLKNEKNMGKGYGIKRGMLSARKNLILFTDSDKSTPMKELDKFEEYIPYYDIVIGSRGLKESDVRIKQPFYKTIAGKIGNKLIIQLFLTPGIKDTQCGFKLFKKNALFVFEKQTIERWGFDFEVLFVAKKYGLRIKEVPVTWINDERTKFKFKDYFKSFWEVLKIRINDFKGKY